MSDSIEEKFEEWVHTTTAYRQYSQFNLLAIFQAGAAAQREISQQENLDNYNKFLTKVAEGLETGVITPEQGDSILFTNGWFTADKVPKK